MIFLSYEDVLAIHDTFTGTSGVRDAGVILSAVGRPRASVFGEDAYPDVWRKAAALLHSLARNHGFVDGHKRTAWLAAMTFLDMNGYPLDPSYDEDAAEELVLAVAEGRFEEVDAIAAELVKFTS